MKRIIDVNGAVKEHTCKTLALQQIEHLEAIRDKLMEQEDQMTQSYEQFTIDEQKEIDAATVIYEETAALIKSALTDIQVMIDQAYDKLRATGQEQNVADLNTVTEVPEELLEVFTLLSPSLRR